MELPSSDLLELFMKLLPGFLAAGAFHALTPYPKRDVFERVVAALIFTLFAHLIVTAVRVLCVWIGTWGFKMGEWSAEADLTWGAAAGLTMGIAWAHVVNNGLSHSLLRRLGTTKKTSLPSQWFSAFAQHARYIILQLKDGLRLMGWPLEWPDEPDSGHFLLQRPTWVLDDGSRAAMHQIEAYLVSAKDVEAVEFLRFNDDQSLADHKAEIESGKRVLTNLRKESADDKPREAKSPDSAARIEFPSESPAIGS